MLRDPDILSLLYARQQDYSLPQPFYTDAAIFDAEIRHVWAREWVFALPAAEIPKTGNYVTMQIGPYSVIVVRGADAEVRAFHNTCRHRGSRLCSATKGSAPKIVCPYHQWTYELDGRLLFARDMGPDFDASSHGLKKVHARIAAGMVFVCLAEVPPAFDAFKEQADRYTAPHKMDEMKVAYQSVTTEIGNWKLVMENNRECYHCSGSHPALCRTFDDNPNIAGSGDGIDDPVIVEHLTRCEGAGLPSTFVIDPEERWRLVRVPLLGTAESYTMDGRQAIKSLIPGMPFANAGTLLFFSYPNTWNHFLSDHVITFRLLPVGPTETQLVTTWLVHRDMVEGQDYDLTRLTEVWTMTNDEDRRVVEENQRGINSPAYTPGPYSQRQESGVIQFVDWYCRTMHKALTGRAAVAAE